MPNQRYEQYRTLRQQEGRNHGPYGNGTHKGYGPQAEFQKGYTTYALMDGKLTYRHLLLEALYAAISAVDPVVYVAAVMELMCVCEDNLEAIEGRNG